MRLKENELLYLRGKKFSDGFTLFIREKYNKDERISKILKLTKNKKVLHIGCCDHIPLIEEKRKKKQWLHGLLVENCSKVYGIDINSEGINYLKNNLGINNVECANIIGEDSIEVIQNEKWDYIILGEILEHVDNPVEFLKKIVQKYNKNIEKMLITAPNIINVKRIMEFKKGNYEQINSDHKYWFTPFTIFKVAEKAGLNISNSELYFVDLYCEKKIKKLSINYLKNLLSKKEKIYYYYDFLTLILEVSMK